MSKLKKRGNLMLFVTIFIDVILFFSIFFLMQQVQRLLNSDVQVNLTEIVSQNKDVITGKLQLEMNNLDTISKSLSEKFIEQNAATDEQRRAVFLDYAEKQGDAILSWANQDGIALYGNGKEVDISGREYYRRALQGIENISERTISRMNGKDIFLISVPLYEDGKITGTVQKQYSPQQMYDLCSVSLFSDRGFMYIINSEGYILINSQQGGYNRESDNYFRILYTQDPDASNKLADDLSNNLAGFMEVEMDGTKIFSAYTPIEAVYDWYLISSIPTNAISQNAGIVIRIFYIVLLVVALLFTFSLFYYLNYRNKQQAKLEHAAFIDPITKGNTYTKFMYDLQSIFAEHPKSTFSLFTFDIDNFKYINGYYGFDTGDRILCALNQTYTERLTENERIARVSGDHFVLLLEDASPDRLSRLFNADLIFDDVKVYLSAGLYPITDRQESINLMMDKANTAAQTVKGVRSKSVVIYSEEFDDKQTRDEQVKRDVEVALSRQEIIPFFQPKVDVNTGKLVGAEALARWQTQEGKLIPPGLFIPACESTELIVQIDLAIFEQTLQFLHRNLEQGIPCVPISVNLSRMHLLNEHLMQFLLSKMEQYQIPAHLLELELTETIIFDNHHTISQFIEELHEHELQISMDDFGTGYSSLHMLKDVDIDVLKIDRGFLLETANSERQRAIFATIIEMAKRLHIKVVVEGVETEENVDMMKEFGCSIAQGYFYAKPMTSEAFEKICKEGFIK